MTALTRREVRNASRRWRGGLDDALRRRRREDNLTHWLTPHRYHPALEHGVTHLDVARYSVADYVKQLEKDPETAERLGKEARRIHDTLLCPRCLAAFLVETFEAVNKHLGQSLVLDDSKRIAELLREHADCSTMAEVGAKPANGGSRSLTRSERYSPQIRQNFARFSRIFAK